MPGPQQHPPISALPREILYAILSLTNQTHDVVREQATPAGTRLSVSPGTGSANLARVCRAWRDGIAAGMVPPVQPLRGLELTDRQFLRLAADAQQPQHATRLHFADLRWYAALTIVCGGSTTGAAAPPTPPVYMETPRKLTVVITDGRSVDVRPLFHHFRTPHPDLAATHHRPFLASLLPPDRPNDLAILVWHGRVALASARGAIQTLPLPLATRRADLSINRWTDAATAADIPWLFGQLCRAARPETAGFHLLAAQHPSFSDRWRRRPCAPPTSTPPRALHVSGIGSESFMRLLWCAAVDVWCVRRVHISLPPRTHDCHWDYRIFDAGGGCGCGGQRARKPRMRQTACAPGDGECVAGGGLRWAGLQAVCVDGGDPGERGAVFAGGRVVFGAGGGGRLM